MTHISGTILFVEDHALFSECLKLIARRALPGVRFELASTLAQALQSINHHMPTIIVTDLDLPDSFGLSTAESLRTACDVPLILMGAHLRDQHLRDEAHSAGFDDCFAKAPQSARAIIIRVHEILEAKWLERSGFHHKVPSPPPSTPALSHG